MKRILYLNRCDHAFGFFFVMNTHNIIEFATTLHQSQWRSKRIQSFLKNDVKISLPSLTKEQKRLVNQVWKGVRVDYRWFSFFNLFNEQGREWTPFYMPSNLYYSIVDMYYTDYKACTTIEDKNFNSLFFYDIKQPKTIFRSIGGNFLGVNYESINIEDIKERLCPDRSYIVKPSIGSGGGRSIRVYKGGETIFFDDFIKKIVSYDNCIVQEFVCQHEQLASVYADSLNTVRIITFFHDGKAEALSAILRMGVGGGRIDNASAGGIFVGIDSKGNLKNVAYDDYGDIFKEHPTTGAHFEEHYIPGFNKLIQLAEKLHNRLVNFSKLISWDFAIDYNGEPILIEKNASHGGISFHQMCNGPLFGDMTKEVIREVFNKKNRFFSRFL